MKKALCAGVASALVLTMSFASVFAATLNDTTNSGTTKVSYAAGEKFTVTIPAEITVGETAVKSDVVASNILLSEGKKLVVNMVSANGKLVHGTANIAYEYSDAADSGFATIGTGSHEVLSIDAGNASGSDSFWLKVTAGQTPTLAGDYIDTLTFTASVE